MGKVSRMRRRPAAEVLIRADRLDARAGAPNCPDDPAWVRRRADAMRRWGLGRGRSRGRRAEDRRKQARSDATLNRAEGG